VIPANMLSTIIKKQIFGAELCRRKKGWFQTEND
jgi:hypothetical protein